MIERPGEPTAGRPIAPPSYPFARSTAAMLPWSHAARRLEQAQNYWLASVRPDGRPHVTPLWGVWFDHVLFFDGAPATRWARNIAANPWVSLHLESGDDVVILEGLVDDVVTDTDVAVRIVAAWETKYGRLHPDPAGSGVFRLRPRTARAWSDSSLKDGTRWTFEDGETLSG
ncbi:MAG: pyridoxamine 5'-phosphate oxidase family protein [Chloroflexota bacterium]